ncbi:MAG: glycolate oxidase subunit GlcF [Gammaproteobacteria bacterium]|nr:glycolate oxidase subunit GlcF [Gammaproteobacteria bacterium]MBA3731891.1 glycolate oxidase subunit GlcF [Gammaproteobacteria bacterium]
MQTNLAEFIKHTDQGKEADRILRSCVHCGFCNATCPTYQLLGDELDGPRGRIYLIKEVLEGNTPTRKTLLHLDRCLTCVNCETTCPSGVEYGKLVDIGRVRVEEQVARPLFERLQRRGLRLVMPYPRRFTPLLRLGQLFRPLLPSALKRKIPPRISAGAWPHTQHARKMLILEGCVQPAISPAINAATARVLNQLEISVIRAQGAGCCGALSHHLTAPEEAKVFMRRNIDAWWPHFEADAEAVIMTASGCGSVVKQYGRILQDDPDYSEKAAKVSELTKDVSEVLRDEDTSRLRSQKPRKVAFHPPCTLQHGQQIQGVVENILSELNFDLTPVPDNHLCCGSAGTYSILQRDLSQQLLTNKLDNLQKNEPELIATANIGCLAHMQTRALVPVVHWVELLASGR